MHNRFIVLTGPQARLITFRMPFGNKNLPNGVAGTRKAKVAMRNKSDRRKFITLINRFTIDMRDYYND